MLILARTGSLDGVEDAVVSFSERQQFVDYARYVALEQKYKGGKH